MLPSDQPIGSSGIFLDEGEKTRAVDIRSSIHFNRRDPGAKFYGVSQNDWYNYCECEKCKAIDDAEGSHAGTSSASATTGQVSLRAGRVPELPCGLRRAEGEIAR